MDHDKAHGLIRALPKAELHLHIEGSLEPEMLFDLAQRNHVAIPYATVEDVRAAYNFHSLQSFLDLYYQGMSVLQTERDFEDLSYAYTKRMHAEHVRHSEPFFDPQGHLCRGISMKTVYNGLMAGFKKGEAEFGISIHLIFSFLRHTSEEECMEFIQQKNEDGDFIRHLFATGAFVAVGLDSTEVGNPPTKFKRLYEYCRAELKVPMAVAHAGEEGPASFIWDSLNILHVNRIDHGVACRHDEKLRAHLKETQMPLTVCPLSNVELKVFATRKDAAVATIQLLHEGLCVTINSDDPAYFGGYVEANYVMLLEAGNMTAEDLTQLAKNSFTASFLPEVTKAKYVAEIDAAYAKFKSA